MATTFKDEIKKILSKYSWQEIKTANKEMKRVFGNRLSQIKGGQTNVSYYILDEDEEGDVTLERYDWDFFYRDFDYPF